MTATDKLLELIEKEDPEKILSQKDLVRKLDELLKYRLIELQNGKIILTREGKKAKQEGVEKFIKKIKLQTKPVALSRADPEKNNSGLLCQFLLLIIPVLVLLLILFIQHF